MLRAAPRVDGAGYEARCYTILRAFATSLGADPDGMIDHLKAIPREMVGTSLTIPRCSTATRTSSSRCADPAGGRALYGCQRGRIRFLSDAGGYFCALNPHPQHHRDVDFNAVGRRLEWRATAYRAQRYHSSPNLRNAIRKGPRSFLPRIAGVA